MSLIGSSMGNRLTTPTPLFQQFSCEKEEEGRYGLGTLYRMNTRSLGCIKPVLARVTTATIIII
jgi:hypothetical protein